MSMRSRWSVMPCALVLLWATGWYSVEGGPGLLVVVVICAALAAVPSRPLLRTTRAVIWGGLLLGVLAVSVNLERIVPPEGQPDLTRAYLYDRMVTLALVPALAVLFMRPSRLGVTLLTAGTLPMLMLVLARGHGMPGATDWSGALVWGGLFLPVLAGQALVLTMSRPSGVAALSGGECWRRASVPALSLLLAVALAGPVSTGTRSAIDWGHGQLGWRQHRSRHIADAGRLSLSAPPGGLQNRVRPVILIEAPAPPGYLREAAYRDYASGVWVSRSEAQAVAPLRGDAAVGGDGSGPVYALPVADSVPTLEGPGFLRGPGQVDEIWRMELLPRYSGERMCLPVDSVAVHLDGDTGIVVDADGIALWGEDAPLERRFGVQVPVAVSRAVRQSSVAGYGLPFPAPADAGAYLAIPAPYANVVSNWVVDCEGLLDADSPQEAMRSVVRHFRQHFDYALEPSAGRRDLLLAFMAERRGHCTLFATASVLMLRQRGIPARVVGGYVSTEWHPLTRRWVVRERDGHAWCEAWDDQAGCWRLVEATPAGGLPGGFSTPGAPRLLAEAVAGLWRAFRAWVADLNPLVRVAEAGVWMIVRMRDLLASPWGALLAGLLAAVAGFGLMRRRRRSGSDAMARRRAALVRAMQWIERRMASPNCRRAASESWADWRIRMAPRLTPAQNQRLAALLEAYQRLRYHPQFDDAEAAAWLAEARDSKRSWPEWE